MNIADAPDAFERHITIRHLRLVHVLGRELSVRRTAELLHTTQPAVSRALSKLEALVGTPLFQRTTKRVSPTEAGFSLMQHAARILAELGSAQEAIESVRGGYGNTLSIGAVWSFSTELLAAALQQSRHMLPDMQVSFRTQDAPRLARALLTADIDLMLSHAEFDIDLDRVSVEAIYPERTVIALARNHTLARRKRVSSTDLASFPWILPPYDSPLRLKLGRMLAVQRKGRPAEGADVQTDSPQLAIELVRRGALLWAVPLRHALQYEASGELAY